ncbi:TspO/MBR family protein [Bacillus piscicola]|uniref:TspO/MBR family protein n=1 Tax=Bacillus piscicola TaxID=1632684 RepID=UPI001F089F76|nr:TspO/MBR family protein [Bacillus piscicola]
MELIKVNGRVNKKRLIFHVLAPIIGGSITGWLANRKAQEKFKRLEQPSFSPPAAVFPVAWTTLYGLMGLAKYRISETEKQTTIDSIPLYELQLGLNYMWSFLFFKWNLRGTALMEMTALLGMIMITTYVFYKKDRVAGTLMIPYIGWVTFALGLNYSFWKLNKSIS